MKPFRQLVSSLLFSALITALLGGCVTRRAVQEIVAESNAAMLARQLGADGDLVITAEGKQSSNALEAASARIDAFIAAHPDQPATAAALRVRQGMLLLSGGELELARAAFAQAAQDDLHTPRDQTLKAVSEQLVWWFGVSKEAFKSNPQNAKKDDYAQAVNALSLLLEHQRSLSERAAKDREVEGIRDYVAETRAWIGLRYAGALGAAKAELAQAAFVDTVTNYVATLGAATTNRIPCGCRCAQQELPTAIPLELRRCFRARVVLKYAHEIREQAFRLNPPLLPEASAWLVQDWPQN